MVTQAQQTAQQVAAITAMLSDVADEVKGSRQMREDMLLTVTRAVDKIDAHDIALKELRSEVNALNSLRQYIRGVVWAAGLVAGIAGALMTAWLKSFIKDTTS
jgi:hypothetical protein